MALNARFENTFDLPGANALKPPICMPIDATFANPHKANVLIEIDRGYFMHNRKSFLKNVNK